MTNSVLLETKVVISRFQSSRLGKKEGGEHDALLLTSQHADKHVFQKKGKTVSAPVKETSLMKWNSFIIDRNMMKTEFIQVNVFKLFFKKIASH